MGLGIRTSTAFKKHLPGDHDQKTHGNRHSGKITLYRGIDPKDTGDYHDYPNTYGDGSPTGFRERQGGWFTDSRWIAEAYAEIWRSDDSPLGPGYVIKVEVTPDEIAQYRTANLGAGNEWFLPEEKVRGAEVVEGRLKVDDRNWYQAPSGYRRYSVGGFSAGKQRKIGRLERIESYRDEAKKLFAKHTPGGVDHDQSSHGNWASTSMTTRQVSDELFENADNMADDSFLNMDFIRQAQADIEAGEYADIIADIQANGITDPIQLVRFPDGALGIDDGYHRLLIADQLGIEDIPVQIRTDGAWTTINSVDEIVPVKDRFYHSTDTEINGPRLLSANEVHGAQGWWRDEPDLEGHDLEIAQRGDRVFGTQGPQTEFGSDFVYEFETVGDDPFGGAEGYYGEDFRPEGTRITRRFRIGIAKHGTHDQSTHGNWADTSWVASQRRLITPETHRDVQPRVDELAADIEQNGMQEPIVLDLDKDDKWFIADGNHRLIAAEQLGMERVPVEFASDNYLDEAHRTHILDWIERHELVEEGGKFVLYHGTPKTSVHFVSEGLRPGSLLETDPDNAAVFASKDRGLGLDEVVVFKVKISPWEIHGGVWGSTRHDLPPVTDLTLIEDFAKHRPGGQDHDQDNHGRKGDGDDLLSLSIKRNELAEKVRASGNTDRKSWLAMNLIDRKRDAILDAREIKRKAAEIAEREAGIDPDDYRGQHQPSGEYDAPLHEPTRNMPDDFFTHPEWYFTMTDDARQSYNVMRSVNGQPNAPVTVYRAVPVGVQTINPGDWVTLAPGYAHLHGESSMGGSTDGEGVWNPNPYTVLSREVKASEIRWPADSLAEFGWWPSLFEKHSPGGQDHEQDNHGRKGASRYDVVPGNKGTSSEGLWFVVDNTTGKTMNNTKTRQTAEARVKRLDWYEGFKGEAIERLGWNPFQDDPPDKFGELMDDKMETARAEGLADWKGNPGKMSRHMGDLLDGTNKPGPKSPMSHYLDRNRARAILDGIENAPEIDYTLWRGQPDLPKSMTRSGDLSPDVGDEFEFLWVGASTNKAVAATHAFQSLQRVENGNFVFEFVGKKRALDIDTGAGPGHRFDSEGEHLMSGTFRITEVTEDHMRSFTVITVEQTDHWVGDNERIAKHLKEIAKHTPGGKEHEQDNHGNGRGGSFKGGHTEFKVSGARTPELQASDTEAAKALLESGKPLYRGMGVVLPPELKKKLTKLLQPAMTEADLPKRHEAGKLLLDHLTENGIGRHWTQNESWAEKAADRSGGLGATRGQWNIVVEIEAPDVSAMNDVQDGRGRAEMEVTLKPDHPYTYRSIKVEGDIWYNNFNLLDEPISKHYPGGQDHDQSNHGRRGGGLGMNIERTFMVGDTEGDRKPPKVTKPKKPTKKFELPPGAMGAPLVRLSAEPNPIDRMEELIQVANGDPINAWNILAAHHAEVGAARKVMVLDDDAGGMRHLLWKEMTYADSIMDNTRVAAVDAYIAKGHEIRTEIAVAVAADTGPPRFVDEDGNKLWIPQGPKGKDWERMRPWLADHFPDQLETYDDISGRVDALKVRRERLMEMHDFRKEVANAADEPSGSNEFYRVPRSMIAKEGNWDNGNFGQDNYDQRMLEVDVQNRDFVAVGIMDETKEVYGSRMMWDDRNMSVTPDQAEALRGRGQYVSDWGSGDTVSLDQAGSAVFMLGRSKSIHDLGMITPTFVPRDKTQAWVRDRAQEIRRAKLAMEDGPDVYLTRREYVALMWAESNRERASIERVYKKADNDWISPRVEIAQARSKERIVIDVLSKHQPMGNSEINTSNMRRSKAQDQLAVATNAYPDSWIDKSNEVGEIFVESASRKRAHYNHFNDSALRGRHASMRIDPSANLSEDTLHEIGHRFEYTVYQIGKAENEFRARRIKGEEIRALPGTPSEFGWYDQFITPYMGRDYQSKNLHEVFTTAYPYITGRKAMPTHVANWIEDDGSIRTPTEIAETASGVRVSPAYVTEDLKGRDQALAWPEHEAFVLGMLATIE